MNLRDLLTDIVIVGFLAAIAGVSIRSCYDNYHSNQQSIRETQEAEPTTRQAKFGQYTPGDANGNYDSNSR